MTAVGAGKIIMPGSREEAVAVFGDGGDLTVLAGGTILMPEITYGRLKPSRTLLLQNAGLSGIRRQASTLTIGAMTRVAQLAETPEPLATAAGFVGDPEIRAQATIGGNLCAPPGGERPRGDLQAALIALGGRVRFVDASGERVEPVEDFLATGPDVRLVLELEVDEPRSAAHAAVRRPHAHAYTILAVCAAETANGVRVALTGAGATGIRAHSVERALGDGATAQDAAQKALDDAAPVDDALASAWYRRRMLPVLVQRALDDLRNGRKGTT